MISIINYHSLYSPVISPLFSSSSNKNSLTTISYGNSKSFGGCQNRATPFLPYFSLSSLVAFLKVIKFLFHFSNT